MDNKEEYIAGTLKGKIFFFSFMGVGLFVYLMFERIIDYFFAKNHILFDTDPIQALEKDVQLLLAISIILLIISLPFMLFAIKLALRVKKCGCWPPPDTPMPFRTKIRRGGDMLNLHVYPYFYMLLFYVFNLQQVFISGMP